MQRGSRATAAFSDYTAVLDGQQRITSLYIGSKGKYRTHIKGKPWDKPESYIDRFLCIDVLFVPGEEEEYRFAFLPESRIEQYEKDDEGNYSFWIRVQKVFEGADASYMADIVEDIPENNEVFPLPARKQARKMLTKGSSATYSVFAP